MAVKDIEEHAMQTEIANQNAGGWWRRTWHRLLLWVKALERGPMEEMFDSILRLEREVGRLRSERQKGEDEQNRSTIVQS
jgi:hypothetical protein